MIVSGNPVQSCCVSISTKPPRATIASTNEKALPANNAVIQELRVAKPPLRCAITVNGSGP